MEVKELHCWEVYSHFIGVLEGLKSDWAVAPYSAPDFRHWSIILQIYKKNKGTVSIKEEDLTAFLLSLLCYYSILQWTKLAYGLFYGSLYTPLCITHRSAADCICYQTSHQSNFQRDCLKLFRQREWIFLALYWEYIFNMACLGVYRYISKKDLFIYLDSFELFVLCISMSSTKSASSSKSVLSVC